jgi:hypothetical protein
MSIRTESAYTTSSYINKPGTTSFFVINPGPYHAINHSSIWNVTEEELHKLEKVSDYHRVGDCEIYFYNADDRSRSPVLVVEN